MTFNNHWNSVLRSPILGLLIVAVSRALVLELVVTCCLGGFGATGSVLWLLRAYSAKIAEGSPAFAHPFGVRDRTLQMGAGTNFILGHSWPKSVARCLDTVCSNEASRRQREHSVAPGLNAKPTKLRIVNATKRSAQLELASPSSPYIYECTILSHTSSKLFSSLGPTYSERADICLTSWRWS